MMKAVHLCVCGGQVLPTLWGMLEGNSLINILNTSVITIIAARAGLTVNSHLGVNSSLNCSDGMKIKYKSGGYDFF